MVAKVENDISALISHFQTGDSEEWIIIFVMLMFVLFLFPGECCAGSECQFGICTKGVVQGDPGTFCDIAKDCKGIRSK